MVFGSLELRKATLGRGFNRQDTDLRPDEELIQAVWGWDGRRGVFHAYIPAERPLAGRENYAKLLPWRAVTDGESTHERRTAEEPDG